MRTKVRRQVVAALVAAALGAGLAAPRAGAQDKGKKPRGLAGAGLTQAQVDAAIDKGRTWLLTHVREDAEAGQQLVPGQPGFVLVAHALASADAFSKDKEWGRKVVEGLYKHPVGKTYETALLVMALERLGGRVHAQRIVDAVQPIIEGQGPVNEEGNGGGWGYGDVVEGVPSRTPPVAGPGAVIEVTGGLPLTSAKAVATLTRKTDTGADGDNSTSQFGVLTLHSAEAAGVKVPEDCWTRAIAHFVALQNDDGGWAYSSKGDSYGSMVCAGLSGLAIALHHAGTKDLLGDARVQKGLGWLARNLSWTRNPGTDDLQHYFYYVYGLERVGVLLGLDFLGDHEWYPEGCKQLLALQREDGAFVLEGGGEDEVQATCFALMFLTKATTPLAAAKGGSGSFRTALKGATVAAAAKQGLYFILDASGSMQEKIGGKAKWEIVRDAAKKIVAKLPDDALVGLRVYGHNPSNPRKVDERETELLLPVAKLDRAKFAKIVDAIKPTGRTPIAMSFDRCSTDLGSSPPCRVLLLSDGAETGGGDPVASARALASNPGCLGIDCLGFDLVSEPKAREQLQEVARVGKGRYTESEDPEILGRAGARAGTEYALLDAAGKEIARGTLGDARPLPEGEYRIRVTVNDQPYEATVWVNSGVETAATVYPERAPRK